MLTSGPGGDAYGGYVYASTTSPSRAPSNLTAQAVSPYEIQLAWQDNSTDEQRFDLYRQEEDGPFSVVASPAANSTSYADTSLQPGTRYTYYLWAVNAGGPSSNSNEAEATTQAGDYLVPAAPTGLGLVPTANSMSLKWQDNSDGDDREDGFMVERDSGSGFTVLTTLPRDATSYNDTGLEENRQYRYRVQAFNATGVSPYSNVAVGTTIQNGLPAPSNLTVVTVSSTQLRLNWSDSSANETGFRIFRWSDAAPTYQPVGEVGPNVQEFLDSALSPNTRYIYYVVAVRGSVVSSGSNKATGRTAP
jgi:predicted phage tail protein